MELTGESGLEGTPECARVESSDAAPLHLGM